MGMLSVFSFDPVEGGAVHDSFLLTLSFPPHETGEVGERKRTGTFRCLVLLLVLSSTGWEGILNAITITISDTITRCY